MIRGKVNGHVNGSVSGGEAKAGAPAEAEWASNPDGTKQAFLSLEQTKHGQPKASVREVFKKVDKADFTRWSFI